MVDRNTEAHLAALRKTEAACYNDIAAAIRNHFPGIEITGAQVAGRANELLAAEERLQTSDCCNCGQERFCQYAQGAHNVVRINCPLWWPKK